MRLSGPEQEPAAATSCEQNNKLSGSVKERGSGESYLVDCLVNYSRADSHGLHSGAFHEALNTTRWLVTIRAMDETEAWISAQEID